MTNQTKAEDWEEEFDLEFPSQETAYRNDKDEYLCTFVSAPNIKTIKTFIKKTRVEAKKEEREKCIKEVMGCKDIWNEESFKEVCHIVASQLRVRAK